MDTIKIFPGGTFKKYKKHKNVFFTLMITAVFLSNTQPVLLGAPADSPVTSTWILDDGTEVALPSYFYVSSGVLIMGLVDANALTALQRGMNNYVPVKILGKGVCFLWFLTYSEETDLGAYHEVAVTHLAKKTANNYTWI